MTINDHVTYSQGYPPIPDGYGPAEQQTDVTALLLATPTTINCTSNVNFRWYKNIVLKKKCIDFALIWQFQLHDAVQ